MRAAKGQALTRELNLIEIKNLSKSYGPKKALDSISLEVREGEIFGFLGPNGAGKTTTIKIVTGVTRADSGTVKVADLDIASEPLAAKALIGYIPDRPYLHELLTVDEFLTFVGGLYRIPASTALERGLEFLSHFDMEGERNNLIEGFSHGMKQKVIMAAALIHEPRVLIVDEPMVGLDPKSAATVKGLFRKMAREKGITIFLSTHTLSVVEEICTNVGIIHRGRIVASGKISEIMNRSRGSDSNLEEVFLQITDEEAANDSKSNDN